MKLLIISIIFVAGCTTSLDFESRNTRQCELEGGIVMRHHDKPVCVAREGLRFLPIEPEYGP